MGAHASTIGNHHAPLPVVDADDPNSFRCTLNKLQMELNPQLPDLDSAVQSPTKRRRHAYDDLCPHEHLPECMEGDDVDIQECDEAHMRHCHQMKVEEQYEMGRELGRGGQAIVRLCWEKPTSTVFGPIGRFFACKTPLSNSDQTIWNRAVQQEADILLHLRGVEGLVHLERVLEDKQGMKQMLFPYCGGGDLLAMLEDRSAQPDAPLLSEREACTIFKKLAQAVMECHDRRIIHRDIKLDNVFLNAHGDGRSYETLDVMLGDFGHAVKLRTGQLCIPPGQPRVGTKEYMAPEIVARAAYDCRADVWSLGVLLYALLTSKLPFTTSTDSDLDIFHAILTEELPLVEESFLPFLSLEAKDILNAMLRKDPRERLHLQQALEHPWVQGHTARAIVIQEILLPGGFISDTAPGPGSGPKREDEPASSCELGLGGQSEIDVVVHRADGAEEDSGAGDGAESAREHYYFMQMSEALVANHVPAIRAL